MRKLNVALTDPLDSMAFPQKEGAAEAVDSAADARMTKNLPSATEENVGPYKKTRTPDREGWSRCCRSAHPDAGESQESVPYAATRRAQSFKSWNHATWTDKKTTDGASRA